MELYLSLSLAGKSEKEKCAVFLYVIGSSGRDIFNAMILANEEKDKIDVLFQKFEERNITVERYKFNTRSQTKDETIDQFITALRFIKELEDELIRDRIVCGTNSDKVKERLLREHDLTLAKAVSISRAEEESKKQMKYMSDDIAEPVVHAMKHSKQKAAVRAPTTGAECNRQCQNCGSQQHPKGKCPAYGKRCMNCNKYNHFAKKCRAKKTAKGTKSEVGNSESEHRLISAIKAKTETTDSECYVNLGLQGTPLKLKIDTGSQANILPQKVFQSLREKPQLMRTSTKLTSYSGNTLPIMGQCKLTC